MQGCNKEGRNELFLGLCRRSEPFMDFLNERLTTNLTRLTAEERAPKVESFYKDVKGEAYDPSAAYTIRYGLLRLCSGRRRTRPRPAARPTTITSRLSHLFR